MDDSREPGEVPDGNVDHFLSELRDACLSAPLAVEPRLAHLLAYGVTPTPAARRSSRMKLLAAKLSAAFAVALAGTGGLAAASALPGPVQSAVSDVAGRLGVDLPSPDDDGSPEPIDVTEPTTTTTEPTETTEPVEPAPPVTEPDEGEDDDQDDEDADERAPAGNHGREVSEAAHDDSTHGCEHGRAVSSVASGRTNDKPCPSHDARDDDDDDDEDGDGDEAPAPPSSDAPAAPPATDSGEERRGGGHDDDDDEHASQGGEHGNGGGGGNRGRGHGKGGGDD